MDELRSIPQRELRNNVAEVLRQVEAGARLRVTVRGRPVAELVPLQEDRATFVPWARLRREMAGLLDADDPLAEELSAVRDADDEPEDAFERYERPRGR